MRFLRLFPAYVVGTLAAALMVTAAPAAGQTMKPLPKPKVQPVPEKPRVPTTLPQAEQTSPPTLTRTLPRELSNVTKIAEALRTPPSIFGYRVDPAGSDSAKITIFGQNLTGARLDSVSPETPGSCSERCQQVARQVRAMLSQGNWAIRGDTITMTLSPWPDAPVPSNGLDCPAGQSRPDPRYPSREFCAFEGSGREEWNRYSLLSRELVVRWTTGAGEGRRTLLAGTVVQQDPRTSPVDKDGDGHGSISTGGDDCDDRDPNRYPGNFEAADEIGHDEDCDYSTIGSLDRDGDGFISDRAFNRLPDGSENRGTDCDDMNIKVNPASWDIANGRDDDCDGAVDEDDPNSPNYVPAGNP